MKKKNIIRAYMQIFVQTFFFYIKLTPLPLLDDEFVFLFLFFVVFWCFGFDITKAPQDRGQ